MRRNLSVDHNAPPFQHPNKNVFSSRLNCSKLMSVCLRWAGRLFHSVGHAAAKHRLHSCCRSVWRHVLELAERSWRRPSSETSWQSAAS